MLDKTKHVNQKEKTWLRHRLLNLEARPAVPTLALNVIRERRQPRRHASFDLVSRSKSKGKEECGPEDMNMLFFPHLLLKLQREMRR
jgi:hypothetical protein